MGEAEQQILKMLSDGVISAEEASVLLRSMKGPEEGQLYQKEEYGSDNYEVLEGDIITPGSRQLPPELLEFRRYYYIATLISLGSLILSAAGLYLLYQSENPAYLGFLCLWSIFLAALFGFVVLLVSNRSTWLYLNVEEQDGSRIRFALPLPLSVVNWFIRGARPFVPAAAMGYLETAGVFLQTMRDNPDKEPIAINIDEGTGDKIQIYIG